MGIKNFSELHPIKRRAIIINYNTKNVTFLALLSALRYANVPVLLIDCESTDGSFSFFKSLLNKYSFELLSAPLQKHGLTLDWIFAATEDEEILLIDSDVEILNGEIFSFIDSHINNDKIFGGGFLDGTGFLKQSKTFYFERPYMPLVLFKVKYIKQALKAGKSFADVMIKNEYSQLPAKLARIVKKIPVTFNFKLSQHKRQKYFVAYPDKVYYDTGAKIYEYLKFERFLFFLNLPEPCLSKYITHFWGATRSIISPGGDYAGDLIKNKSLDEVVLDRLLTEYNEVL